MLIGRIANATRNLGAPPDWNPETDGNCAHLPIRDEPTESGNVMVSAWYPTPQEVQKMINGAPVYLHVFGAGHPPVMLTVGEVL